MGNTAFYRGLECAQAAAAGPEGDRVASVHLAIDGLLARTEAAPHRACRAGCSWCCHHPVGVTWLEAEGLFAALAGLPAEASARLAAAIAGEAEACAAIAWQALRSRPCPLLCAGTCALYDARPVPCRAWASLDAAACERAFTGRADIPCDAEAFALGLGASSALAAAGGPPHQAELRSALAAMLAAGHDADARRIAFASARRAGT